ncbi:FkbM family methyltransferase [Chitinophaga qingshengii]|uniref:FkbM family methyltransferase n=1 Tax=Chitinophaga qingshengii TaxID=1569794 RepID=A0ABR7TG71_9BACT|nr:FkbM family methyltransferase [Chitinophaga qingshengii]MBC9929416.1 FkbM family methyltransferase [Chitinophaga qingshengii]
MNILFKMADAARIMIRSGRGPGALLRGGASIASTQLVYNCSHYIRSLHTILDVGANIGQFALAVAHRYPQARIYSFEPEPDTYLRLQQHTRKIPAIRTFNFALGSSDGALTFYSNAYSHASSALQVSAEQILLKPQTAHTRSMEVPVKQLDQLPDLPMKSPTLLKLDVQGFEQEVLRGASATLRQIDYLLFETSFIPMYNGEPLFDEMHHFVKSLGFDFIAPVGFLQSDNLQILQMDLLYQRRDNC